MVEIKGGYTPGQAWGSHSGFETGWDPGSGGGGGSGNVWGLLQKQQQMKDMQAQAQLNLIAEQIAASRQQRMTRPERAPETAEQAAIRYMDWAAKMNFGGGPMATYGSKKYHDVMSAADATTKAAALRGIATGGGHADISERGPTEAFQRQSEEAAGRETIAPFGASFAGRNVPEMGDDTYPGSRFGPGFNTGLGNAGSRLKGGSGWDITNIGITGSGAGARLGGEEQFVYPQRPQMPAAYGTKTPNFPALPPQEEGTLPGTIPETGQALMHEGEAVIPAEQVDQPLLRYLRQDAMRKGVPLGQASGGGYGCGTLKYADGSLGQGFDPEAYARFFAEGNDPLQRGAAAQRGIQGWQSTPKPPAAAIGRRSPWLGKNIGLMTEATEAVKAGKPVADDVVKVLGKTKKGRTFLESIGISAAIIAAASAGASGEKGHPWYRKYTPQLGAAWAAKDAIESMMEGTDASESIAGGIRNQLGGYWAGMGEEIGGFAKGLAPELAGEQPMPPAPEGPPVEQMMGAQPQPGPPGPPPGSLEGALGRTSLGDFGSPEAPLQLQGQPEAPYPETMQDLRSLPENITARHKAGMNMVEAERLLDHLQFHGHKLDPQQYEMLTEQAKQKMALGQMYGKTGQDREKFMQEQARMGTELQKALQKIQVTQSEMGKRQLSVEEKKTEGRKELAYIREEVSQLGNLIEGALNSDSSRTRADNKDIIAGIIQQAMQAQGKGEMGSVEALERADELIGMGKEDQTMMVTMLQQIIRGGK